MTGQTKTMNVFERYLTLWVALCMVVGVLLGKALPGLIAALRGMEFGSGCAHQRPDRGADLADDLPDDAEDRLRVDRARRPAADAASFVTLVVNWLVKPFSMAFFGWLFFTHLFLPLIGPELASQYIAGVIILAAAPCTAMVFVWSYLPTATPPTPWCRFPSTT